MHGINTNLPCTLSGRDFDYFVVIITLFIRSNEQRHWEMVFVNSDQVGYECDFLAAINVRKNLVFGDLFFYHELADVFSAFSRSFEILCGIVINVCCNEIPDCQ